MDGLLSVITTAILLTRLMLSNSTDIAIPICDTSIPDNEATASVSVAENSPASVKLW